MGKRDVLGEPGVFVTTVKTKMRGGESSLQLIGLRGPQGVWGCTSKKPIDTHSLPQAQRNKLIHVCSREQKNAEL